MTSTQLGKFAIKELRWWYRIRNTFNQYGTDKHTRNLAFRHVGKMLLIYQDRVSSKVLIKAFNYCKSYWNNYCKNYNRLYLSWEM